MTRQNGRHIQNSNPNHPTELEPSLREGRAARAEPSRPPSAATERSYPLGMVLKACPDLADYAKGGISNWRDFLAAPAVVRPMLAISPSAWEEAQAVMGEAAAAVVVACILQRDNRDQVRRRLPSRAHPQGGSRPVQPGADAHGADRPPKQREETRLKDKAQAHGTRRHRRIRSRLRIRAIVPQPSPEKRRREGWLPLAPSAPQGVVARLPRVPRALATRPPRGFRAGQGQANHRAKQPAPALESEEANMNSPTPKSKNRGPQPKLSLDTETCGTAFILPPVRQNSPATKPEPITPPVRRSPRSPRPPASPNKGRLKPRFNIKLQPAKPFERSRLEPACPSPTSSHAIGGRRSPPLVTRLFGASGWRPAGHCRAWEGSSNAIIRPCSTRSAR